MKRTTTNKSSQNFEFRMVWNELSYLWSDFGGLLGHLIVW